MKKYNKPELNCIKLKTQCMLAGSPLENGFNKSEVGTISATSGNMGRDGWFDEDEE